MEVRDYSPIYGGNWKALRVEPHRLRERDFSTVTPGLATCLDFVRRPAFLLYVLFWIVLVNVIWDPVPVWQHTSPETPSATKQQDPFDLRFPVEIDPGPAGLQFERGPIVPQPMPSPSTVPFAQVRPPKPVPGGRGVDPRRLRRIMDLGVAQFASATDDAGKSKGASLVQLSALLGYPPARELVVRNYLRSPAVRGRVSLGDAVRFAVEFLAQGVPASSGAAEVVIALGNYFSQRGDALRFARHIVDAISDDDRLQTSEQLARLFSVFARMPGMCVAIKQTISADLSIDRDGCSNSLNEEFLRYASSNGEVGIDAEGRVRALRLLDEVEGTLK